MGISLVFQVLKLCKPSSRYVDLIPGDDIPDVRPRKIQVAEEVSAGEGYLYLPLPGAFPRRGSVQEETLEEIRMQVVEFL